MTPLLSALEERAQEHDAPPQVHAEEEEEEEEEGRRRPQVRGGARQVHYYIMRAHTAAIKCVRILLLYMCPLISTIYVSTHTSTYARSEPRGRCMHTSADEA